MQDFVRDVMLHWLRRGIDGWRLDAAYAVPAEFWAAVLPAVRSEFADAWFVGEMIHGDYVAYVERSGIDSVTQYELWKAVWSSLDTVNLHELEWTLGRHAEFVEHFVPMTFVGNHDTTRVASQIHDQRHWPHAVALLGFLPGVPCVYYGDEFGLEAVKEDRPDGDDAVRPALPAERGQFADPHPEIEEVYRRVFSLRRQHPWLVDAVTSTEQVTNTHLLVHARARTGEGALTLALNLGDDPYGLPAGAASSPRSRPGRRYRRPARLGGPRGLTSRPRAAAQVVVEEVDRAVHGPGERPALEGVVRAGVDVRADVDVGVLEGVDRRSRPADRAGAVRAAVLDQHRFGDPVEVRPRRRPRQKAGESSGRPYVLSIFGWCPAARGLSSYQRSQLSASERAHRGPDGARFTSPGCAASARSVTPPPIERPNQPTSSVSRTSQPEALTAFTALMVSTTYGSRSA